MKKYGFIEQEQSKNANTGQKYTNTRPNAASVSQADEQESSSSSLLPQVLSTELFTRRHFYHNLSLRLYMLSFHVEFKVSLTITNHIALITFSIFMEARHTT